MYKLMNILAIVLNTLLLFSISNISIHNSHIYIAITSIFFIGFASVELLND